MVYPIYPINMHFYYLFPILILSCISSQVNSKLKNPYMSSLFSYSTCCSDPILCENLGNGVCDPELNSQDCAWDQGDCGYCNENCFIEDLLDKTNSNACSSPFCHESPKFSHSIRKTSDTCNDGQMYSSKYYYSNDSSESYEQSICIDCPDGTYSIYNPDSTTCFKCNNDTMECENNELKPKKNIYRFELEDSNDKKYLKIFRKCPEPNACNDTSLEYVDNVIGMTQYYITECADGYKGKMCHSCGIGYTKTSIHTCAECPDKVVNVIITLVIIFIVGIITYYLITTTLTVCFDPGKFHSIGLKIFINYIQVIYLCLQYRITWPSGVKNIAGSNSNSKANSLKYYYFSIKCLINEDIDENDLFYYRVYFMVCLPVISLIFSTICIIFINIFKKKSARLKHYKSITIMVPYFLIYPYVLSYSLSPIACESLEQGKPVNFEELNEGESYPSYLIENRDIWCNTSDHKIRSYPATVIGLILWGIIVPFCIFIALYRNRRNLHNHKIKYRFGFLFSGYLRKRFFWEFVIIAKKFVLVVLTVIMQSDYNPNTQSLLLITSLLVFLVLHVHFTPYITRELNNLELLSSLAAIITILAGIVMSESAKSGKSWLSTVSAIVILVINSWFVYIWVKFMFWNNIRELFEKYEFLKRFFDYSDGIDQQKLKEFEKINYMYTEEMQTVYTQIKDINGTEVVQDFNRTTIDLMREIIKVSYNDYSINKGPVFKSKQKKKSIYVQ